MSTCIIIGAGEGLDSALAAKFASEGFDIALVSRTEAGSMPAHDAAMKAGTGTDVKLFPADVTQPETLEKALSKVATEMSDIDVLIYNVRDSYTKIEPLEMTYDMIDAVHKLEVIGAFAAVKAVLPGMGQRGRGSIFFSSATAALRGSARVGRIPALLDW